MIGMANSRLFFRLIILISLIFLYACNDKNIVPNSYISAIIQGKSSSSDKLSEYTFTKGDLPASASKIEFVIEDISNGSKQIQSLEIGEQTQSIKFRVEPHRNLSITINVYSSNILTFIGESSVPALRPGETYPLNVELIDLSASGQVVLAATQNVYSGIEGDEVNEVTEAGFTGQSIQFTLTLSTLANGNVSVDYATVIDSGTAISSNVDVAPEEVDYFAENGTLVIPAGQLSATFEVFIAGDRLEEPDETFNVALSNASANVVLATNLISGKIVSDDYIDRLNDTGSTLCADYSFDDAGALQNSANNRLNCDAVGATKTEAGIDSEGDVVPAGQDAHYGHDLLSKNINTLTGRFNYTKLDINGTPLANQTQDYATNPWACVKDNYTGLIWEVKTIGISGNKNSTYTWFNSTLINDGGDQGIANGGSCVDANRCDTEKYVEDFNLGTNIGLICGISSWRLPSVIELRSLIDNSSQLVDTEAVAQIDGNYFSNTVGNSNYWTSNSLADPALTNMSWIIDFIDGSSQRINKSDVSTYIRLVSKTTETIPIVQPSKTTL